MNPTKLDKHLVLIGGGHSHVFVLKRLGMQPVEGLKITLISNVLDTPYSGMLPGFIAGHYSFEETHIDLRRLARFANADFIHSPVTGLDPDRQLVFCDSRPAVPFDVLSINTGSTPAIDQVPGADRHAVPVKPIAGFLAYWEKLRKLVQTQSETPLHITVVGGGAGGVELLLSMHHRLCGGLKQHERKRPVQFTLITASKEILPTHNRWVRRKFAEIFRRRNIPILTSTRIVKVNPKSVQDQNGSRIKFDSLLWTTQASPPNWIAASGLSTDESGFISVNGYLQSHRHENIFAAGDVAASTTDPRPKSGVFAVRSGPVLTENLMRFLSGKKLQTFRPQKNFLSLISTGDSYAVMSRGGLAMSGRWVWDWKDWIDRSFMRKFQELPSMVQKGSSRKNKPGQAVQSMRCGGCGAKVPGSILKEVIEELRKEFQTPIPWEDASSIRLPKTNPSLIQSLDFFKTCLNDPFLFGRVAANHALNDLYAKGAEPHSALALAVIPHASRRLTRYFLRHLLHGAVAELNRAGAVLLGGHSAEGADLSLGFTVQGFPKKGVWLGKTQGRAGDKLILTKPLGTGCILAADMMGRSKSQWTSDCIGTMLVSNRQAMECLLKHGVRSCSDVSGFGLAGHLLEMLEGQDLGAHLYAYSLPLIEGVEEVLGRRIVSTLQASNRAGASKYVQMDAPGPCLDSVIYDPQTSGGLLATLPADNADKCLIELKALGYHQAGLIGELTEYRKTTGKRLHLFSRRQPG